MPRRLAPTCDPINIKDLQEAQRADVRNGITEVNGLEAAQAAMHRLRMTALLPECEQPKPQPNPNVPPPSGQNPPPASSVQPPPPPDPNQPNQPPSPEDTPLQQQEQKPGVTCRTVS